MADPQQAPVDPNLGNGNQILMVDKSNSPVYVNPQDLDKAQAAGLTPATAYVDPQTQKTVVVPRGQEAVAQKAGLQNYYTAMANQENANTPDSVSPLVSGLIGAAKNATFGFAPQVAGAAIAGEKLLGGDTNVLQNYTNERDQYKNLQNEAYTQNPGAYLAGAAVPLVGSLGAGLGEAGAEAAEAAPSLLESVGGAAKAGAGYGDVGGAGNSNADLTKGQFGQFGQDIATGAGLGAALGGGTAGVLGLGEAGVDAAKEAGKTFSESIGNNTAHGLDEKALLVLKGLFTGAKTTQAAQSDLSDLAAQKADAGLGDTSLLSDIFSEGPNPTKDFVAQKAETALPGNAASNPDGDSLLTKVLNLSPDERTAARNFNKNDAASSVVDDLTNTISAIKQNRSNIFSQGQSEAAGQYGADPVALTNVSDALQAAMKDAQNANLGSNVTNALDNVQSTLAQGKALSRYGIAQGDLDLTNPGDVYKRLQASREALDGPLQQARQSGDSQSSYVLGNLRSVLDTELKSAPAKAAADQAYAEITQPLKAILAPITDKATGTINPYKLGTTFDNSVKGLTFRDNLTALQEAVQKYGDKMDPDTLSKVQGTLGSLQDYATTSQNQKLLNSLRQASGPTSPAVERTAEIYDRAGLNSNLITKPASALTQADNYLVTQANQKYGKAFSDLNPDEKNQLLSSLDSALNNPSGVQKSPGPIGQAVGAVTGAAKTIAENPQITLPYTAGGLGGAAVKPLAAPRPAAPSIFAPPSQGGPMVPVESDDPYLNQKAQQYFHKGYNDLTPTQQRALNFLKTYTRTPSQ